MGVKFDSVFLMEAQQSMWGDEDNTGISEKERNYNLKRNAKSRNSTLFTLNTILLE
jgi:hypothetical protein